MSKSKTTTQTPELPDPFAGGLPDPDEGNIAARGAAPAVKKTVSKPLMDDTMRLATQLDRILAKIPDWGRKWALAYLNAKYGDHSTGLAPLPTSPR